MKIPKRIKIGGHWVGVDITDRVLRSGKQKIVGRADYAHREICLCTKVRGKRLKGSRVGETFLHEILHLVYDDMGFEQDESMVGRMSVGLYAVLHNNKLRF